MRRLKAAGGAGRAGAGRYAQTIQHQQDRLALDILEGDVAGIWQAVFQIAIDAAVTDALQEAVFQLVAQQGYVHALMACKTERSPKYCSPLWNVTNCLKNWWSTNLYDNVVYVFN